MVIFNVFFHFFLNDKLLHTKIRTVYYLFGFAFDIKKTVIGSQTYTLCFAQSVATKRTVNPGVVSSNASSANIISDC